MRGLSFFLLMVIAAPALAAPPLPVTPVSQVTADPRFERAVRVLAEQHERTVEDIVRITEIPAPPFREQARAQAYRDMLLAHGLTDVAIDQEGNVVGRRPGSGAGPVVVVSAHLDTVFPEGTPIRVSREGTRLAAPGIGDDARGLAVILAWLRAMDEADIETQADIVVLGSVGEEGTGDLRGVRHFFSHSPWRDRVAAFISVDGIDPARIIHGGVGSKRYRVTFHGPGGHSYNAFGLVNPLSAMARAIVGLYALVPPREPKTTYAAATIQGGTSVNSIPREIFGEFDLRSEEASALAALDGNLRLIVEGAARSENEQRSTSEGAIRPEMEVIGDRPAGRTDPASPLVQAVRDAGLAAGFQPNLDSASTDANLPMSLGIPAVTIGSGGSGGRAHSLDEYIDVEPGESVRGMRVGLAAILSVAGLRD